MSSITINGDTSGSVILQAPSVAGSTTLTLPTTTGTLSLTASPTFTGQATIPTINLTGGQITFPATQNPSSDANTLDDYEEGTWTPIWVGSSTAGSCTYNSSFVPAGNYVKVGQLVTVSFSLLTTSTHSGTGNLRLSGLPFTISGSIQWNGAGSVGYFGTLNASLVFIGLYADASTVYLNLVGSGSAGASVTNLSPSIIQNNSHVIGSFTYRASA